MDKTLAPGLNPIEDSEGNEVSLSPEELASALRLGDSPEEISEVSRLFDYAIIAVRKFGPQAPAAVLREAVIRLCGFLFDAPFAPKSISYANSLTNSGAAAILAPYRVHRGGSTALSEADN